MPIQEKVNDEKADTTSDSELIKFVVFKLAGEEYCVEVSKVREILKMMPITFIPDTPSYIKGVINLRSKIVVIIDLEQKLALKVSEQDSRTRIIILELFGTNVGVIVDEVSEVLNIPAKKIEEAPPVIMQKISSDYLRGVAIMGERLLIAMDFDSLLKEHAEEIKKVELKK